MNVLIIKRIIGVLVAIHVIPIICIVVFAANPQDHPPINPYLFGWVINFIAAILFGVIKFIAWCFEE